ncbi:MAG: patatin-like phospholipase family protein [Acidobacteriia bacterium]|nr:patatin-like phospholipase family protein [Terriglobia bacterium]
MKTCSGLILIVVLLLPGPCVLAQFSPTRPRPKIGIALEGGGAKGLAHIGVLEWFEEHRIPIDYIAGTSMGGLVGGLYATGRRPDEIRELIREIDWDKVLAGRTPYLDLDFRRKEDLRANPNGLVVGLRHGPQLPSGLNSGHEVSLILDRYVLPYSGTNTFDDLPIPFRCVGTDLVSGKQVVFKEGSLAEALRSTMSLPGIFSPVKQDGTVYADGGLLNDLPTDVVKQMGADIVIAVHLSSAPVNPRDFHSLLGVAGRSIDVMIGANELRGIELADILITIETAGFTTLDFKKTEEIMPKGYTAARGKEKILSEFSVSEEAWQQVIARREAKRVNSVGTPQFVEVRGTSAIMARDIQKELSGYVGRPIDTAKLERDLTRLKGVGRFDRLGYTITNHDGQPGLLILADEKDYAPPVFKPGFEVNGSDPKSVQFSMGGRLTFQDAGGYRSELRSDLSFGSVYAIRSEYYHPLTSSSRWFIAPRAGASSSSFNIYSRNTLLAEYRMNRADVGADFGYAFDRFSELRLGYEVGYLNASRRIGSPLLPSQSARTGASTLRFVMDRLDSPVIPRRGIGLEWRAQWVDANLGARSGFPLSEATFQAFQPISDPASIYLLAAGGTTFGHNQTGLPPFSLGGPSRLAAYGINEFLTNQYFYFRAGYLHRLARLPPFLGNAIHISGLYEVGKAYNLSNVTGLPNDGAVGLVVETVLGPAFVGASVGDSAHRKWFFQLGKIF